MNVSDFWEGFRWRFGVAVIIAILCSGCVGYINHPLAWSGIILSISYMGTMGYIAYRFKRARYCSNRGLMQR